MKLFTICFLIVTIIFLSSVTLEKEISSEKEVVECFDEEEKLIVEDWMLQPESWIIK